MTTQKTPATRQEAAAREMVPWHPMLFSAAMVMALYLDTSTSFVASLRPLVVFVLGALALSLLFGVATRSLQRGALITSLCVLLIRRGDVAGEAVTFVLALAGIALASLMMRWRRVASPMNMATNALNTVSLVLIGVLAANILVSGRVPDILADLRNGMSMRELEARAVVTPRPDPARPDVYVIMLDGYPRRDTLTRLFDFDNSPFIDALEQRGLSVSGNNHSNYMYTGLSLTSMLNMQQLPDMRQVHGENGLRLLINHNPVFDEFRRHGYLVIADQPGWESDAMRNADVFCGEEGMNDFELNLVASSLAGRVAELAAPNFVSDRDRYSINSALDCIGKVADIPLDQPRFMFAHIPNPHLPIVFRSDGSRADPRLYGHTQPEVQLPYADFARGYTQGLEYLNSRVLAAIDDIMKTSATPPVIVVFSDHGSESHLNWADALLSDMDERFGNFTAALTPGADGLLGEAPTPVNIFPILLNHYFGASIPLQPDDMYVSTVQDRLGLSPRP
jgi:hypothetical protein